MLDANNIYLTLFLLAAEQHSDRRRPGQEQEDLGQHQRLPVHPVPGLPPHLPPHLLLQVPPVRPPQDSQELHGLPGAVYWGLCTVYCKQYNIY